MTSKISKQITQSTNLILNQMVKHSLLLLAHCTKKKKKNNLEDLWPLKGNSKHACTRVALFFVEVR